MRYIDYKKKLQALDKSEKMAFLTTFGYITDILDEAEKDHNTSLCYCNKPDADEPCETAIKLNDLHSALRELEDVTLEQLQPKLDIDGVYYHGI